jgi:surface antigen
LTELAWGADPRRFASSVNGAPPPNRYRNMLLNHIHRRPPMMNINLNQDQSFPDAEAGIFIGARFYRRAPPIHGRMRLVGAGPVINRRISTRSITVEKAMTRDMISISRETAGREMREVACNRSIRSHEVSLVPIKQSHPVCSRAVSLVPTRQVRRQAAQPRVRSLMVGCALVLVLLMIVNAVTYARGAMAQGSCAARDQRYSVAVGDTLSGIAARYNTNWMALASYNHLANASLIMPGETICVPTGSTTTVTTSSLTLSSAATIGRANLFPYGQCTWWANERYAELHNGAYVPWTWNSDAWQWTNRALDFHWQVVERPSVGDIIDLQPGVQGASGLGHVGVVEQILANGNVLASSMNWGLTVQQQASVSYAQFVPGSGVTFIRQ